MQCTVSEPRHHAGLFAWRATLGRAKVTHQGKTVEASCCKRRSAVSTTAASRICDLSDHQLGRQNQWGIAKLLSPGISGRSIGDQAQGG
jgi:hypothetical protein